AITVVLGVAVGLMPCFEASRGDLPDALQQSSLGTAGNTQLARRAVVVAGVGLALGPLVGAGVLVGSTHRLMGVAPGFDGAGTLSMQVQTYGSKYDDNYVCHRFFDNALDAVRQVPGVTEAAFTSQLPLSGDSDVYGARFESDAPEVGYEVYR